MCKYIQPAILILVAEGNGIVAKLLLQSIDYGSEH